MELITVGLYGDGSRDARLRAEYVYCDRAEKCSAFCDGKCFGVTALFGMRCPYAKVNMVDGGLKRSKAYGEVYSVAKNSEKYAKLDYPHYTLITKIGGEAFLTLPFVQIKVENGKISTEHPMFVRPVCVDSNLLTPENLEIICSFRPRAMLGGEITDYQEKTIPMFLLQFSRLYPEKYHAFIEAFPEYADRKPDWVGRMALLNTCNREKTYRDASGNEYHFEGDYIVGKSKFAPFALSLKTPTEIRAKVTDDMKVKITDNDQVLDSTVFV